MRGAENSKSPGHRSDAGDKGAEWVVLELTSKADGEDPDLVRASIRHLLRDAEVFVPASVVQRGEARVVSYLMEGYAFIRRTHPDERYFRLEGSKYVQAIVTTTDLETKTRRVSCVYDRDIDRFRAQIHVQEDQGINNGDRVVITSGPYKNLTALVVGEIPEMDAVQVHVPLRSKDSLVTLPRAFLRLHEKAAKPLYHVQREALKGWVTAVIALAQWQPKVDLLPLFNAWQTLQYALDLATTVLTLNREIDTSDFQRKVLEYEMLQDWVERSEQARPAVVLFSGPPDTAPLVQMWEKYAKLNTWVERAKSLSHCIFSICAPASSSALQAKYAKWAWLDDKYVRLTTLLGQIERAEQQMAAGGVQNLVIDGHNLAIRCATTPGLGELKDSQGRPTGAIVGFLNALVALKKHFPGVDVYVTWDGSSDRRKAIVPEYKQGRGVPRATFEISRLQALLPKLGVTQVWNAAEEADDVIATLVRKQLGGQSNVIFSTDRDLLQLVTESTVVLSPKVGARKERMIGPAEVEAEYGVKPSQMVQLRALAGDTSDNLPGCPGCGLKTATRLVQLYGAVDNLFRSNLAGLPKGLTANLRASEATVRMNVRVMALIDDLETVTLPPDPDETAVVAQLNEIEVKPENYLPAFLGAPATA